MNKKHSGLIALLYCIVFALLLGGLGLWAAARTPDSLSLSERRKLAQRPELTKGAVADGSFFEEAEDYLLDQFPLRDGFRRLKALCQYYIFGQKDNNGIIISRGHAAQLNYSLTEKSKTTFFSRLNTLNDSFLSSRDMKVYTTLIPDKMYFLQQEGYPVLDYAALQTAMEEQAPGTYVDIFATLELEDYYTTDSHWKESEIISTASLLLEAMGREGLEEETLTFSEPLSPFYGVYYGESALPLAPDEIVTVHSEVIDGAQVQRANAYKPKLEAASVYVTENISADDPYDIFLGGACGIISLTNTCPSEEAKGHILYLFSDSFGRSLAPLLLAGYEQVVVYDIRYMPVSYCLSMLPMEQGQDVLLAYSVGALDVAANLQVQ